jgi:hypothetical protein
VLLELTGGDEKNKQLTRVLDFIPKTKDLTVLTFT